MSDTTSEAGITAAPKTWRVGTLVYTRAALVNVFIWMLWGDFCLQVMEAVIPRLVPLQLKAYGTSSAIIGLLVGSIPAGMNFVMNPIISTASDRHRGRRRACGVGPRADPRVAAVRR